MDESQRTKVPVEVAMEEKEIPAGFVTHKGQSMGTTKLEEPVSIMVETSTPPITLTVA